MAMVCGKWLLVPKQLLLVCLRVNYSLRQGHRSTIRRLVSPSPTCRRRLGQPSQHSRLALQTAAQQVQRRVVLAAARCCQLPCVRAWLPEGC